MVVWSKMGIIRILAHFNLTIVKWDLKTTKFNSLPNIPYLPSGLFFQFFLLPPYIGSVTLLCWESKRHTAFARSVQTAVHGVYCI